MLVRTYSMSQAVVVGSPKSRVRKDKQLACQSPKRDSFCGFQMKKPVLSRRMQPGSHRDSPMGLKGPKLQPEQMMQ